MLGIRSVPLLALAVLAVTCGPSPDAKLPAFPGLTGGGATAGAGGQGGGGGEGGGAGGRSNTGGSRVVGSGGRVTGTGGRIAGTGGTASTPDAGVVVRRDSGRGTGGGGGVTILVPDASRGGAGGSRDASRDVLVARDLPAPESRITIPGTGGIVGRRDAAPIQPDAPGGCMGQVVANDYTCGSAAPCSACESNGESKEAECKKGVDCLANAGPSCDNNCQLACLNSAGDSVIQACIKALQTAACSGPGC